MSKFRQLSSDKIFTTMTYVSIMLVCHFLVFPLAALSHYAIVMLLAYFAPLVVGTVMRRKNLIDLPPSKFRHKIFILTGLAVIGFLFWHQMTLAAIVLFIIVFFSNTAMQSKVR